MRLDSWYHDFLFDGDHALTTTAQIRCGLSTEDVLRLTAVPADSPELAAAASEQRPGERSKSEHWADGDADR